MEEIYTTLDLERVASDDELKASLLEMLLEFDAFCKEHDLTYYLSGGTLLGAVRHKGFIPWDDDIDVNMPRPDCEKLMELSGGKIGKFTLVPPNNATLTFAYHWKLYGDDVLVSKRVNGKKSGIGSKIYPAFVDIFPIEGLPASYDRASKHYDEIRKIKQKARFQSFLPRYRGRNPFLKLKYRLAQIYFDYFVVKNYHDEVIKHAKKYSYETSDHIGVMMTDVHGIVERVEKSDYTPVIEMEFEGKTVKCPQGHHAYLKQLYGPNYMTVLPPHQQVSRHSLAPFKRKTVGSIDPSSVPAAETKLTAEEKSAEQAAYQVSRSKMEEVFTPLDLERLATAEDVKASHLGMLLAFDKFCKQNKLTYFLSGSTLLGAVRNNGFLPWDCNISLNMPRPDCEKLMRLSGGTIGTFTLVPPNTAAKTFSYHWQLLSDDILVSKKPGGSEGAEEEFFPSSLDIFPIEGLPDSSGGTRSLFRGVRRTKLKAARQAFPSWYPGIHPIRKIKYDLALFRLTYFDTTDYHDEVSKLAKRYSYETAEHVGVMLEEGQTKAERIKKSAYGPAVKLKFEGHDVCVPAEYTTYLAARFGEDFMNDLPPHQQFPRRRVAYFVRKIVSENASMTAPAAEEDNLEQLTEV